MNWFSRAIRPTGRGVRQPVDEVFYAVSKEGDLVGVLTYKQEARRCPRHVGLCRALQPASAASSTRSWPPSKTAARSCQAASTALPHPKRAALRTSVAGMCRRSSIRCPSELELAMPQSNFWGRLIAKLREEQRISQRTLASPANVPSLPRCAEFRRGHHVPPTWRPCRALAHYLGYELEALQCTTPAERLRLQSRLEDNASRLRFSSKTLARDGFRIAVPPLNARLQFMAR